MNFQNGDMLLLKHIPQQYLKTAWEVYMSYITFVDGSANLPNSLKKGIEIMSCNYTVNESPAIYNGNLDEFNYRNYYNLLRNSTQVQTSLMNTHCFVTAFRPYLEKGIDIICFSMSSAISGTFHSAEVAAEELTEEFPHRKIYIIDSKTCGLGIGLQAVRSAELNSAGVKTEEAAQIVKNNVEHACSYFTVDNLNFLKRTGRISGATAAIGTVLNIKPILLGNSDGQIVSCAKVRGRKNAVITLAEKYREKVVNPQKQTVYISHGDCLEDANALAEKIRSIGKPADIIICPHEPISGAHVGPGMLGLFFYGSER